MCIRYLTAIVFTFCMFFSSKVLAQMESDKGDFLAKETEGTLKILNYKEKSEKKEIEKQKEQARLKALKERQNKEYQQRIQKEQEAKAKLEQEEAFKREQEEEKLRQEQLRIEAIERARHRKSKVKFEVFKYRDLTRLGLQKDVYSVKSLRQIGLPEDKASTALSKQNIITEELYVRLLTQTNINSRRAGKYIAIVERDVYSPDSQRILIPKGSKFICSFKPLKVYGETSLQSTCNKIYFPNGRISVIAPADVYDTMGRPGIVGTLDNRMFEKYGQTIVLSLLGGAAIMGSAMTPSGLPNSLVGATSGLAQYTGLNILDMSMKILDKTIDLAPIVTISSGTRIILKLSSDLNLENGKEMKDER